MALPDNIGLVAGTSRTTGIAAQTCENGNNFLGSAINNAANLDDLLDFEFVYAYGTNPTAAKTLKLVLLYSKDGTNYEEGAGDGATDGSDVDPLPSSRVLLSISPDADTGTHRILRGDIPLLPYAFKMLLMNVDTGQTVTVTVTANTRKSAQITD